MGAGEGFEPPTSGLSLRAGRRRISFCTQRTALLQNSVLWATPLTKTIHRIVFVSLTQRATLVGLIIERQGDKIYPYTEKRKNSRLVTTAFHFWVQGRDLNPRPPGYHFVPVAVVSRFIRKAQLCFEASHFGRHRLQKQFTGLFLFR